jgi:beta-galactosidase
MTSGIAFRSISLAMSLATVLPVALLGAQEGPSRHMPEHDAARHAVSTAVHDFRIAPGAFMLDGKPFQIISGELHYARIPRAYWRQRLRMAKAMGLNTIATYVFWDYHEIRPGVFDFRSGNRDLAEFIRTAQQEGLWVILRPGPYVCAEWDFGGYPAYLLRNPAVTVRGNDPRYLKAAQRYVRALAEQVRPLLVTHGGPILMVQVENEYGSFGSDSTYKESARRMLVNAGIDVPLFTADGDQLFAKGGIPGVFAAANGETSYDSLAKRADAFNHGVGPYMVAEFYPGWLTHWAEPFPTTATSSFLPAYDSLLAHGVSVNLYMFHGGTNFGFTSGANYTRKNPIEPSMTSYDYDAPLSEAGWPTPKYYALRDVIQRHVSYAIPAVPDSLPVIAVPSITLTRGENLFDLVAHVAPVRAAQPLAFEDLGQADGYIMYRHRFDSAAQGTLAVPGLRDYGEVFVNGHRVATLDRRTRQFSAHVDIAAGSNLDILVENMGRINYGPELVHNRKGIIEPVTLDSVRIETWSAFSLPFARPPGVRARAAARTSAGAPATEGVPAVYRGSFELNRLGDTFLDMRGWRKGIVFVNGINLGRYWNVGPQQTLYLPGAWLHRGRNEIVVFDQDGIGETGTVTGLETPILNDLRADNTR